jgi:predicted transcriptional regulator of viral defense system
MGKTHTTTLSGKELEIIEKLLAQYGNVVSFGVIYKILAKNKSRQEVKNMVSGLAKKGWLVRVKRGVYVISDISSRGTVSFSQLAIAQIINENSYISFEAALQHYSLFDQYLRVITSMGKKKSYTARFSDWTFKYIKTKNYLYGGYEEFNIDGRLVKVATREKAILDFLIYRRTANSIDLVIEKLKSYKSEFDIKKFEEISKNCSITIKRALGAILDLAGINSDEIYKAVKKNKNHSFMTATGRVFNAKWRIYVDSHFKNY